MHLVEPERDERTDIPQLDPEAAADLAGDAGDETDAPPLPGGRAPGGRARRRPREAAAAVDEPPPPERPAADTVTEAQLVRAFYWLYRGWCRLLGAEIDAHHSDFADLGKAWLDLARKVPGIRWVIAAAGPLFTLTDLLDKLARAWDVRTRFRAGFRVPNWRERSQQGAEAPDLHVADGGTGAP